MSPPTMGQWDADPPGAIRHLPRGRCGRHLATWSSTPSPDLPDSRLGKGMAVVRRARRKSTNQRRSSQPIPVPPAGRRRAMNARSIAYPQTVHLRSTTPAVPGDEDRRRRVHIQMLDYLAIVLAAWSGLMIAGVPGPTWVGLATAPLLAAGRRSDRALLAGVTVHNVFVWMGSLGTFQFLGTWTIPPEQSCLGILFGNLVAIVGTGKHLSPAPFTNRNLFAPAALVALTLLAPRLASGIPLLQGDQARLSAVQSINPYIGLLGGCAAIVAAFLPRRRVRKDQALYLFLVLVAALLSSRLLLIAVIVGGLSSATLRRPVTARRPPSGGRAWLRVSVYAVVLVVGFLAVYSLRTATDVKTAATSRFAASSMPLQSAIKVFGPGAFLSMRNGHAVYLRLAESSAAPPDGYVQGSLLANIGLAENPELWNTRQLGFDVSSVGAVATPIWAALTLDHGVGGLVLGGIAVGVTYRLARRRSVLTGRWIALGIAMSSYGSYLASLQFLVVMAALLILTPNGSARRNTGELQGSGASTLVSER